MSVTARIRIRGKTRSTGRNAVAEIMFSATGEMGDDDDEAAAAILAAAPPTYAGLKLEGIGLLEEIYVDDDDPTPTWEATVRYVSEEMAPREPGSVRTSFRTTGGSAHILQSIKTRAQHTVPGQNPIDFQQLIGVSEDGSVEGTTIITPVFEWQESHVFADSQITPAYVETLYLMTGTTNDAVWRIFAPEDCLFTGVDGQQLPNTDWELNFGFSAQPTKEIAAIGDIVGIGGGPIIKRGWQYLWIYTRQFEGSRVGETITTLLKPKPVQVNVEQVYFVDDFLNLGLGA
jgi:hypothetical protein